MPDNALFDLASVTKAVGTTTALALCMDRGLLDPDAPFTVYLPDYRGKLIERVSIRDLARHLSGFPNQKPYDVVGEVMDRILDFNPVRAPGLPYEYSCGNFILLGLIVERLLDADLGDLPTKSSGPSACASRWAPAPRSGARRSIRRVRRLRQPATRKRARNTPRQPKPPPPSGPGRLQPRNDRGARNGRRVLSETP